MLKRQAESRRFSLGQRQFSPDYSSQGQIQAFKLSNGAQTKAKYPRTESPSGQEAYRLQPILTSEPRFASIPVNSDPLHTPCDDFGWFRFISVNFGTHSSSIRPDHSIQWSPVATCSKFTFRPNSFLVAKIHKPTCSQPLHDQVTEDTPPLPWRTQRSEDTNL